MEDPTRTKSTFWWHFQFSYQESHWGYCSIAHKEKLILSASSLNFHCKMNSQIEQIKYKKAMK